MTTSFYCFCFRLLSFPVIIVYQSFRKMSSVFEKFFKVGCQIWDLIFVHYDSKSKEKISCEKRSQKVQGSDACSLFQFFLEK